LEVEKKSANPHSPKRSSKRSRKAEDWIFFSPFSSSAYLGLDENQSRIDKTTKETIKMDKSKISMPLSAAIMSKVTTSILKACKT
jgi:hypothetical protein